MSEVKQLHGSFGGEEGPDRNKIATGYEGNKPPFIYTISLDVSGRLILFQPPSCRYVVDADRTTESGRDAWSFLQCFASTLMAIIVVIKKKKVSDDPTQLQYFQPT